MMTSTGSRRVGQPRPRVYARLLRRRVAGGRPAAIAATVETFRLIGSPGFAFDEQIIAISRAGAMTADMIRTAPGGSSRRA